MPPFDSSSQTIPSLVDQLDKRQPKANKGRQSSMNVPSTCRLARPWAWPLQTLRKLKWSRIIQPCCCLLYMAMYNSLNMLTSIWNSKAKKNWPSSHLIVAKKAKESLHEGQRGEGSTRQHSRGSVADTTLNQDKTMIWWTMNGRAQVQIKDMSIKKRLDLYW